MNNLILTDHRIPETCRRELVSLGCVPVGLPSFRRLSAPVWAHPDMLAYPQGNTLLMPDEYLDANRRLFSAWGCGLSGIPEPFSPEYPRDVRLNALRVGDTVYGLKRAVAAEILREAPRFVNVHQGYARCSVAVIAPDAAITADRGLASALQRNGVDVLLIQPGGILLPGLDTGFIGGCGGRVTRELYVFFGNIRCHPDYGRMQAFAELHGVTLYALSDDPLSDYGGLVRVPEAQETEKGPAV